jgi:hypothetical protein
VLVVAGLAAPPAESQTMTAALTYPANGSIGADMTLPFQWTAVAGAQCYYLYVGTTPGAKDVIDTGEIAVTSYQAPLLPAGRTLYVRLWTYAGGVWRYVDSTFTAALVRTPRMLTPADGSVGVNLATQPMTWTAVANAHAYYLYVGTAPGRNDVVNTGEILTTSYQAGGLPANQQLYARIWAKVAGIWYYRDSTFSAAYTPPVVTTLTYPANGSTNVDLSQDFQWPPVENVQVYYLYVGSTPGASDLFVSGEIQKTSYRVTALPGGAALHARLWTKVGGLWRYRDSAFTTAPAAQTAPTLLYPANGATDANLTVPFTWTVLANVQRYYLYVGSTPGAKNFVDSGELSVPTYLAPDLPVGQTLYVRLWALVGNRWHFTDASFIADPPAPLLSQLTYPRHGTPNANLALPIQWTAVPSADSYKLWVGTTPGTHDLLDTGDIHETSVVADSLPSATWLYARLWTRVGGIWRYTDSTFSSDPIVKRVWYPPNGAMNADLRLPIQWIPTAGPIQAYKLFLGTAPGESDLLDTNEIQQTRWFTAGIPAGQLLHARLWTKVLGVWRYTDSSFTAVAPGVNDSILKFSAGPGSPVTPLTGHTESGFTVWAFEGNWQGSASSITFTSTFGQARVVAADGGTFRFNSVDVSSSALPIPYTITGFRNDVPVFTIAATVPQTSGNFRTIANPHYGTAVDAVTIGLTNRWWPCCPGNPVGIDNISVSR